MELGLRLLLFLRKLITFFRKRWDQSTRRLWYIFAFVRSRIFPRSPKKGDEIRRNVEYRPAKPPTTVICASKLPPPLTPIPGGDTPIASPTPISIQVRHPTILSPRDPVSEPHDGPSRGFLDVDSYFLEGSGPISRSPDSPTFHHEPEHIRVAPPQHQEDHESHSPVIPSRPISQYSGHSGSQYSVYRPQSQYSIRPPSQYSNRSYHNGAEAAARGYLHAPPPPLPGRSSPIQSNRPPSIANSVASRVYRASRPRTRVARPSPMRNTSKHRARSSTPASSRHSLHEVPPEVPQLEPRTSGSPHPQRERPSTTVSFVPADPPKDRLRPMVGVDRYEKAKKVIIEDKIHPHVYPPVTTEFVRASLPNNWVPLMHPEGALYWVHKTEPIYTDTNMCNPDLLQKIEQYVEEINNLKEISPPLPEDWELVLELGEDDETDEPTCSYYFVRHSTRCLFWLHEFDLESVLMDLCGVTEHTHIHLALQSQYWTHWEAFPHNREVPEELLQELSGILLHAGIDCMTSTNSTTIYSEPELNKLLGYVRNVKRVGGNYGFAACVVGRLMTFFMDSRYVNFYGQKGARLTNDQTIYDNQPKRTYLIKTLSVFFFYAPELHLRGLESVYTDYVICQHRWAHFITRLQSDWAEFILYGTVLLNANVAFLAIPSVDPGNHNRSPAQLASYLSIVASVGSVVTGLLLLRQHRTKPQDAAEEVDRYLRSRLHNALGFETLAILYSLPYSLLLWATVAFLSAFGLEALLFSNGLWTRVPVGVILVMILMLISWCIWTTLEAKTDFSLLSSVHTLKDRLVDFTRGARGNASEPGSDVGDAGDDDGQGKIRRLSRSGTLKEAFGRLRPRRPRASTSATLVNPTGVIGFVPGVTIVEMDKIKKNDSGSAV